MNMIDSHRRRGVGGLAATDAPATEFALRFTQGLHRALQSSPDAVATVYGDRTQTFRTVADRVARMAGGLRALGVRRGDCVALIALNSDRVLEYYLAVAWIGAVANALNFRWSPEELAFGLNDSGASLLVVDDAFAPLAGQLTQACPRLRTVIHCGDGPCPAGCMGLNDLIATSDPMPDVGAGGDDVFGVFYTGGTTGIPKGVLLSHANVLCSGLGLMAEGAFAPEAIGLHSAPMFHLADLMMTTCLLLRGGTHVMLPVFRPESVTALIAAYGITDLLMVPTMLQALVDHPDFAAADIRTVRSLLYGASPAAEALIARAMAAMPDVAFSQIYGMTEAAATISILRPCEHTQARRGAGLWRSAGRAFCHTLTRIVDASGVEVGPGMVGEIQVRGPNIMLGYQNRPDATQETLAGGWLRTGDLGYLDEAGYVFIVDRAKDMIITGGENVYSVEVENAVASHPAVAACAVIGIPDPQWGETIHAVVVPKAGVSVTEAEIINHCRSRIAHFKCPRSVASAPSLPISGAGKILKTELRKPFWSGKERAIQ